MDKNGPVLNSLHKYSQVAGGSTTERPSSEEKAKRQKQYMLEHPEQYQKMLAIAKKVLKSGGGADLHLRNTKIKQTMSGDKYRKMSRDRINRWREEHPEEWAESCKKSKIAINRPEVKAKSRQSMEKWKTSHPEEVKL